MALITGNKLGSELIGILGLPKNVKWFELRCAVGEVVAVKCEYYPENAELSETGKLESVFAEYRLEKVEKE